MCEQNSKKGFDLEFKYIDLLNELFDKINPNMNKNDFINLCIKIELSTELSVLELNSDVEYLIKNIKNVKIILISDFYLPKEMIQSIVGYFGLSPFISSIYVSSDFLKTKRGGSLYDLVLEDLKIKPENILMIGDNQHSDYTMAISKNINAIHLNRSADVQFYDSHNKKYLDQNFIKNSIYDIEKKSTAYFGKIVFSLYGFTQLLYERLLKEGCKDVFFLSREGEPLKKLFEMFRDIRGYKGEEFIRAHYILVSRKATFMPSLKPIECENFETLFRQYRRLSLYEFLSSLNFSDGIIEILSKELEIDKYEKQEDFPTSTVCIDLFSNQNFINLYETIRNEQKDCFINYINQFDVDYKSSTLYIVDVGWKGTIQDNIYNIFDKKQKIKGFYLGLVALGNESQMNYKEGLLINTAKKLELIYPQCIYDENRSVFEIILAASHGSANGYSLIDNIYYAKTHHEEKEIELYNSIIIPILNEIYSNFSLLCETFKNTDISYEDYYKEIALIHSKMVFCTSKKELNFFRSIYHFENFGFFEYSTFKRKKLPLYRCFRNLASFIKNPKMLLNNGFWGILTLEDMGIKYMRPFYAFYKIHKINNFFKNIKNK